MERYTHTHI